MRIVVVAQREDKVVMLEDGKETICTVTKATVVKRLKKEGFESFHKSRLMNVAGITYTNVLSLKKED